MGYLHRLKDCIVNLKLGFTSVSFLPFRSLFPLLYFVFNKVPQVLQAQLHDCKEAPFCVSEAPRCSDGVLTCPGYTHHLLLRAAAPTFPALPLVSGLNPTMLTNSLQADSPDHVDTPSSARQGGGNTCLPHKCNSYHDC